MSHTTFGNVSHRARADRLSFYFENRSLATTVDGLAVGCHQQGYNKMLPTTAPCFFRERPTTSGKEVQESQVSFLEAVEQTPTFLDGLPVDHQPTVLTVS